MNLPNLITLSRLALTPVFFVVFFLCHQPSAGAVEGALAAKIAVLAIAISFELSDVLDGYLARRMGLVTPLGKLLDPLADKILVCSGFVFLTAEGLCPVWVTALIIGREFLVTGLRQIAVEAGQVLAADHLGKWKTGFQIGFCIAGLVWITTSRLEVPGPVARFLTRLTDPENWKLQTTLWIAAGLTAISGFNYLRGSRTLLRGNARRG